MSDRDYNSRAAMVAAAMEQATFGEHRDAERYFPDARARAEYWLLSKEERRRVIKTAMKLLAEQSVLTTGMDLH